MPDIDLTQWRDICCILMDTAPDFPGDTRAVTHCYRTPTKQEVEDYCAERVMGWTKLPCGFEGNCVDWWDNGTLKMCSHVWHPLTDANHALMLKVEGWLFVIWELRDGTWAIDGHSRDSDSVAPEISISGKNFPALKSLAAAKAKLEMEGVE